MSTLVRVVFAWATLLFANASHAHWPGQAEHQFAQLGDLELEDGGVIKLGDYVYGYSEAKGWTCQDFKTGQAVWQEKEKLDKGSAVYADGRLYCREEAEKGVVALVEASPSGYVEKGRFTPPDRSGKKSWPHPVVAGGTLYLRDQDVLLCYDVQAK